MSESPLAIQGVNFDRISDYGLNVRMARADKIHDLASGNKIYKLSPIIEYAKANKYKQILSFGGAYSNHIHALAYMAQKYGIQSIAIIRGESPYAKNPTLSDALKAGMQLEFVSREEYQQRNDSEYLQQLQNRYPDALIIPEGGSSQLAIQGCAQMARDINSSLGVYQDLESHILAVASGTGATAAGLVCGLAANQRLIAYSVLKDESLGQRINAFINAEGANNSDQYLIKQADFGGYAKLDKSLLDFILDWHNQTGILLDPIYTSKLCLRLTQQIEAGEFDRGESITIIHSGGLQGWRGMKKRVEKLADEAAWNQINRSISNR